MARLSVPKDNRRRKRFDGTQNAMMFQTFSPTTEQVELGPPAHNEDPLDSAAKPQSYSYLKSLSKKRQKERKLLSDE